MRASTSLIVLLIAAAGTRAQEISWPQELVAADGSVVVIYQPQVEDFTGNIIEGRAAVSVSRPTSGNVPVFGAVWLTARIDTDRDTRTGVIREVDLGEVRFADASDEDLDALAEFIESEIEGSSFTISVDELLADLEVEAAGLAEAELRHEPPRILLSTEPAILVTIDGEPDLQDLEGTSYKRVVNSPFLIVEDGRDYYLYVGSNAWYRASAATGPWSAAAQVPSAIAGLVEPAEDDEADLNNVTIIVATEPTELVVSDGAPSWTPVEGMNLLYMDNTDSDAFLELSTQRYYLLLSGRWYRGEGLIGELAWSHLPNDELPEAFRDIPADSVNGAVLSQVAGTPQARDALLENSIPQTAAINRDDSSFSVQYDGDPDFAPIEDIQVEYAQNTVAAVFRYGNLYYACDDGVWYVANSATGPWSVATEIPAAIYEIPASNPHYNVTYVKVYDVTPEVVYVGYTPGYYGSYYYRGTVVYGTGWYYSPWYGPYYYPRYPTWGFHVRYNPWTGWGVGVSWTSGPFRFTFASSGSWWGVGGYRPYPRPIVYGGYRKTNININVDNSINIGGRNRPEARPNLYNRPGNNARNAARPTLASGRQGQPATAARNDVLTDRSGNIYQRGTNGNWSQRSNGQWRQPSNLDRAATAIPSTAQTGVRQPAQRRSDLGSNQQRPSAPRPQLERDFQARQQGARRAQSFQGRAGGAGGGMRRR